MRVRIRRTSVRARLFRGRSRGRADEFRSSGRLALLAALGLIVAVAAVLLIHPWGTPAVSAAEQTARVQAKFIADSMLRDQLRPADLRSPVTATRRRTLDRLLRRQILIDGIVRASVYGPGGRITYSTDHAVIGHSARGGVATAAAAAARQAGPSSVITGGGATSSRQVLSVYVPLRVRSSAMKGVLELSEAYAPPAGGGDLPVILFGAVVGLALLALYVAISPVPRRVSKRAHFHTKRMEDMERRAFHDTLTGLPNRELLHSRVAQAIDTVGSDGGTVAVMLMDLDRFKEINDTFGHQSGDQLLCEVAEHLSQAVRGQDTVARLGGDEFAILCSPVAGPLGAVALAERAMEEVQRSHTVAGVEVDVDASIGIALFPRHGDTVDELLRCADIAMYASKASGAPTLFAPELDHHSVARLALASQLRRAIAQRELAVYFQPKADFDTGQISSVEALVRWDHPELGLLPPDQFIPLAEQTGLIRPLTTYVLDSALEQCREWRREGLGLSVAVNITGRDLLDQRFAEEVRDLLRKWEVMPSRLELEITENTVLTDPVRARTVLMTLNDLGVRLAIDDFGSGNSSLSYLKRLPIDVLKIDKSFVLQMHANEDDAVIVRSTIDLGHNLGLKVVAEGVSSVTAWDRLRGLGCDVAQGYYLSKPVPGSEIAALITDEGVRSTARPKDAHASQAEIPAVAEHNGSRPAAAAVLSD
jgi:diguanylate cyclase (GGDEF)-like protein